MAKHKIDKETVKEHMEVDELEVYIEKIIKWVKQNVNTLIIIAIIVLIAAIGTSYYRSQKAAKLTEAQSILDEVIKLYISTLYETEDEKVDELLTQIDENVASLQDTFKNTFQASEAILIKGKVLVNQNKFDEAIETFNEYINSVKTPEDQARGYLAIGYALENKAFVNDDNAIYDESINNFKKASELGKNSYLQLEALYNIGNIYKALGKKDLALESYEKITMSKLALDRKGWELSEGPSGYVAQAEEQRKELLGK